VLREERTKFADCQALAVGHNRKIPGEVGTRAVLRALDGLLK
jgi:hypothetical protein